MTFWNFDDFHPSWQRPRLKKLSWLPVVSPLWWEDLVTILKVEGKDLYNSAYFIADGEVAAYRSTKLCYQLMMFLTNTVISSQLPNLNLLEYKGQKIALTICEDIWNIGNENPIVPHMSTRYSYQRTIRTFIINISASPFSYNHAEGTS